MHTSARFKSRIQSAFSPEQKIQNFRYLPSRFLIRPSFANNMGLSRCEECHRGFDHRKHRRVQDSCGHIKCQRCSFQDFSKLDYYCNALCSVIHNCKQCDRLADKSTLETQSSVVAIEATTGDNCTIGSVLSKTTKFQSARSRSPLNALIPKQKQKRQRPVIIPAFITVIGNDPPLYKCNTCRKVFKTKGHINYHSYCHLPGGEKPYQCKLCERRFVVKSHYEYHLGTHGESEKQFCCKYCQKSFSLRMLLKTHLKTHSFRLIPCNYCSRAFSYATDLRRHLVIHTDEKPFKCYFCDAVFSRNDNLIRHMRTLHNDNHKPQKRIKKTNPRQRKASSRPHILFDKTSKTYLKRQ